LQIQTDIQKDLIITTKKFSTGLCMALKWPKGDVGGKAAGFAS